MRRPFLIVLLAATALSSQALAQAPAPVAGIAAPAAASEADFRRAADTVLGLVEAVADQPGAPPALSVVMVRRGQPPVIWTHGRLSADPAAAPATEDTPFYIASQTKAFVGLLATRLDAEGVFDLDQPMAAVWPDLTLPDGADPRMITFRDLLSHQGAFETEALGFRTAYSDRVPAADYGRLLSTGSTARAPGYRYANLGYLIYGAALELKTGRDWRDWLDEALFVPAGMSRSGARPGRLGDVPRYHRWMADGGWDVFDGKPDDLMHAAGGLVVSPKDMARWLAIALGEPNPAVTPDWLRLAQAPQVAAPTEGAFDCQTYALGWNICRIGAADVRAHGGGYTGVRSAMAVSAELGVGFAFFSNSDSLTGALSQQLVKVFFEAVQSPPAAAPDPAAFGLDYGARVRSFAEGRMRQVAERRAEPQWAGWAWRPAASDRAAYAGRYRHPALGDYVVSAEGDAVHARLGIVDRVLEPAAPDLFAVADGPADPPAPLRFERTERGVVALVWDEQRFERVD